MSPGDAALVLLVEDEPQMRRFLRAALTGHGYRLLEVETGTAALTEVATRNPEMILLDLGLPDMDGKDVIARLREWSKTPVIVISARDRELEKIAALDLGANDYVDKPFGIGELLARLRAALRHAVQDTGGEVAFTSGDLSVDILAHTVTLGGAPVKLTPKEFDLLAILVRNAGRVVTHRQILTSVWGPAHTHDVQYLRVFIGQLRQKLPCGPGPAEIIQTEPGIGYRLIGNA